MRAYKVRGRTYTPKIPNKGFEQTGLASWYGTESGSRTTANGEPFDAEAIAAAHTTFPLPSIAEVTDLATGKAIRVRVNDRGPFADGRIIDLTHGAAAALGMLDRGTIKVRVRWLGPAEPYSVATSRRSPSSNDSNAHYIVQLGAFSVRDNAEALQERYDARLERQGSLYIVYLGPFDTPERAESFRQSLAERGFTEAVVRRD